VNCDEGSECTVTTETVCELDMCHLEYSGQCTGIVLLLLSLICTTLPASHLTDLQTKDWYVPDSLVAIFAAT